MLDQIYKKNNTKLHLIELYMHLIEFLFFFVLFFLQYINLSANAILGFFALY